MPVQQGPELQEIETQEVGFLSIAGDAKLRLLPPWPTDSLPAPTSSLLSVASSKGLLAAAGPQGIVIASTDAVRKAYSAETTDDNSIKPFQPQLQIPFPSRISHVAFSAGDEALVVAAQEQGGLAAYDVSGLTQGNTQPSVTIPLNGASLRSLVPNPVTPQTFAAVTTNGELLMPNLKAGQLVQGPTGTVLKSGVSCVSWSNKGKQLVAGLGDGTASQMTPEGQPKAEIPRPPDLQGDQHVSSAVWLENDMFYMVYTPTTFPEDDRPASSYYIINRASPDNYLYRKLPEVCSPFGLERFPAYQFTARLRNFEPDLKDVLVVSSTASTDIGLFTRSSKPLTNEGSVDVFTTTSMSEDSRRAVLPMTDDMADTSPVGLAFDLSCKDPVPYPIPGEDIESSGHPLPDILVLNNDGLLSSWWFVYSDAIRQQKPYHAISGGSTVPTQPVQSTPMTPPEPPKPAFGQPAFGKPAFGTPSALGSSRQPPVGSPTTPANAGPSFGAPTPMGGSSGVAFGAASMLGQRAPAFGQSTALGAGRSTFGQPSALGGSTQATGDSSSPFGGSGFSSFATSGGFSSLAAPKSQPPGASPFSQTVDAGPFTSAGQFDQSAFGSQAFGSQPASGFASSGQKETGSANGSGLGSGGFVLGSTFKPDETATTREDQPSENGGTFSLGQKFGNLLNEPTPTDTAVATQPSTVPAPTIPVSTSTSPSQAPTSLFGPSRSQETPKATEDAAPAFPTAQQSTSFAPPQEVSTQPSTPPSLTTQPSLSESTVKVETPSDTESSRWQNLPEPPLPPDPTSKAVYAPGDTSASSSNSKASYDEPPLPPDPIKAKPKPPQEDSVPLPDDSEGEAAGSEDSGEEVANEGLQVHSFTSRESSFGGPAAQGPPDGQVSGFTPPEKQEKKPGAPKQLFGEIPTTVFPPLKLPEPRRRLTPRSPSPARDRRAGNLSKTDGIRSTSAPSAPGRALSQRKATLESSMLANELTPPADEPQADGFVDAGASVKENEQLELVENDEDEQLRADLQRPLSPAPTLDPFLPHQDYTGESLKPGIPGQIERLYCDINAMVDTLGINSRSLSAFMLHQESNKESEYKRWLRTLQSEHASDLLNEKILLSEVDKLPQGVEVLEAALQKGQVQGIHEKLEKCHQLLRRDVTTLRGQCASMRRTIDSHTDVMAIASAPLSAEQSSLQQDLRQSFTDIQSKLADLERDISQLRAGLADASQSDSTGPGSSRSGEPPVARPTVEAVTSTINTMTNMAEKKSGDIDVLEAQMRKLGIYMSGSVVSSPPMRHDSPFHTPQKKQLRFPVTPGSRDTKDGAPQSAYHTPDSAGRFRSSLFGKGSLRSANGTPSGEIALPDDTDRWKAKARRKKELTDHVRTALESRKVKVRGLDG